MTCGGNNFDDFSDNQLPTLCPIPSRLGDIGDRCNTISYECTEQIYYLQPAVMLKILIRRSTTWRWWFLATWSDF